jgi:hypothetical protein
MPAILVVLSLFATAATAADAVVVEPMITTHWSQSGGYFPDFTYNKLSPLVGTSQRQRAPMGCVAVAFGQVLKHFNYPKRGLSATEYCNEKGISVGSCDKNLVVNFDYSATRFDWANMPDRLPSSGSSEQINAVAELLYAVGASVTVRFGEGGSNAQVQNPSVFKQFRKHFLMADAESVSQYAYLAAAGNTPETWKAMIHAEIIAGRPVILTGTDSKLGAGHGYVLDGLNDEGLVHINLGWGGSADGYYDVNDIFISNKYRFTEEVVAYINLSPNVLGEGARCNGPRGARCSNEFLCVLEGDITKVVDEATSDVWGQCLVKNTPPLPPTGGEVEAVVTKLDVTVTKGEWKFVGPFLSVSGASVIMSGDGDADLYVKLGAQPSESDYDCRPYRSSSDEQCKDMEGPGDFFVGVSGYTAATVSLEITTYKLAEKNTVQRSGALSDSSASSNSLAQNTPLFIALGVGTVGIAAAVMITAKVVKARGQNRHQISSMSSGNPQFV